MNEINECQTGSDNKKLAYSSPGVLFHVMCLVIWKIIKFTTQTTHACLAAQKISSRLMENNKQPPQNQNNINMPRVSSTGR